MLHLFWVGLLPLLLPLFVRPLFRILLLVLLLRLRVDRLPLPLPLLLEGSLLLRLLEYHQ